MTFSYCMISYAHNVSACRLKGITSLVRPVEVLILHCFCSYVIFIHNKGTTTARFEHALFSSKQLPYRKITFHEINANSQD